MREDTNTWRDQKEETNSVFMKIWFYVANVKFFEKIPQSMKFTKKKNIMSQRKRYLIHVLWHLFIIVFRISKNFTTFSGLNWKPWLENQKESTMSFTKWTNWPNQSVNVNSIRLNRDMKYTGEIWSDFSIWRCGMSKQ